MSATAPQPSANVAAPSWNVLSILAFVGSLIGFNVIAVILGFIGLNQVKKTGERGRGFALAGIIIGLISIAIIIIVVIVTVIAAANGAITTY